MVEWLAVRLMPWVTWWRRQGCRIGHHHMVSRWIRVPGEPSILARFCPYCGKWIGFV